MQRTRYTPRLFAHAFGIIAQTPLRVAGVNARSGTGLQFKPFLCLDYGVGKAA